MTTTILAVAAELTPEQRGKLVDRFETMAHHGPMGGAWRGEHSWRPMERDGANGPTKD